MDDEQRLHLENLRQTYLTRLRFLEHREALLGINAPLDVVMEIKDYRVQIADIEERLGAYRPQTEASRRRKKLAATSAVLVSASSAIEAIFMDADDADVKVLLAHLHAAQQIVEVFADRC